jgi:hypothetical protein
MSDYNDIAKRNPKGAISVISSFGYEILDRSNLGQSLNELVANEGEPALIKVMEIHPDKDIILELFGNKNQNSNFENPKQQCGCGYCNNKNTRQEQFMNASGSESVVASTQSNSSKETSTTLAHQTNAILIVATLFIATALIIKTNK